MSLLVSCTILDGILAVSLSNSKPARQVGYVYSLCSADNTVICRQPQSSSPQSRFDLAALGCAGGGYYVEVAAAYRDGPEDAEVRESGKSSMVYYYLTRRLSYDDLEHASFPPGQLTLYEIEWDGVVFEFLLHPVPDSRQMVVFWKWKHSQRRPAAPLSPHRLVRPAAMHHPLVF